MDDRKEAIERLAEVKLDGGAYADSFANLSAVCKAVYDPPFGWTLGAVTTLRDRLVDLLGSAEGPTGESDARVLCDLTAQLRESREYAEDLSGACELLDGVNEELRERVDELEVERDEWKAKAEQATNQPTSQSDALKPGETAENGATKSEMRDFDDSREKLEADVYRAAEEMEEFTHGEKFINTNKILRWLDRQAALDRKEFEMILEGTQECMRNGGR